MLKALRLTSRGSLYAHLVMQELKAELDKLLAAKISDPTFDIGDSGLIEVITQLISTDGLISPQEAAKWSS
jgi:hypothetical protein